MTNITGKLFQNIQTRKITPFRYDPSKQDYYKLIREAQEKGYSQSIITSDIMISLIEHFLLKHKVIITNIEFLVEDSDLTSEIDFILNKLRENAAYWEILKNKLQFLSTDSCIEIKKIDINCMDHVALVSIYVNGVFSVTENMYDAVAYELSSIVEDHVQ